MKKSLGVLICIFFLFCLFSAEEISTTNRSVARLSSLEGDVFLQRASAMDFENAVLNMPVIEGDRLGTTNGRAELHITRGKYIRLNHNTKIDILELPSDSSDIAQIRIWAGNCYLRVNHLDQERGVEIHTPDLSAYILDRGLYRFDIRENQETEIFVFQGLLETALENGSVMIKAEQRIEAIDGHATTDPTPFLSTAEDSFDRWNEQRDYILRRETDIRYLPNELADFETELAESGRWDTISPYGHVWIPTGLGTSWRPYFNGRWIWLSLTGWTWLPYENWGWVTSHYGRWQWSAGYDWFWIPTNVWGPAWVNWYSGPDYWAWSPLSYDGYPAQTIPIQSRALTVVRKDQLQAPQLARVALNPTGLRNVGLVTLAGQEQPGRPESASRMRTPYKTRPADRGIERRNINRNMVYPSSSSIRSKRSRLQNSGRSGSTLGKIYSRIGRTSSTVKNPTTSTRRNIPTRSVIRSSTSRPGSMRAPSRSSGSTSKKKVRKK